MQKLIFLSLTLFSLTANAFEFNLKTKGTECMITEKKIIKKMSVGLTGELSVTKISEVEFQGMKEYIDEVIAVSSTYPQKNVTIEYSLTLDSDTYYLNPNHSLKVQTLSALLSRLCF